MFWCVLPFHDFQADSLIHIYGPISSDSKFHWTLPGDEACGNKSGFKTRDTSRRAYSDMSKQWRLCDCRFYRVGLAHVHMGSKETWDWRSMVSYSQWPSLNGMSSLLQNHLARPTSHLSALRLGANHRCATRENCTKCANSHLWTMDEYLFGDQWLEIQAYLAHTGPTRIQTHLMFIS